MKVKTTFFPISRENKTLRHWSSFSLFFIVPRVPTIPRIYFFHNRRIDFLIIFDIWAINPPEYKKLAGKYGFLFQFIFFKLTIQIMRSRKVVTLNILLDFVKFCTYLFCFYQYTCKFFLFF